MDNDDPAGVEGGAEYIVRYEAGGEVFSEGDVGNDMFIIKAGEVEIFRASGGSHQQLALLEEGDFFGEMAVLEDEPRMASARAVSDCVLMRIDGSTFDQMVRHNPEIPVRMLRKLSRRLREMANGRVCVDESIAEPLPPTIGRPEAAGESGAIATLFHPNSGTEFELPPAPVVYLGRVDPATGFEPTIELKLIDPRRSTSRRHARISRQEGKLFLREEIGVANGTFVNGRRLVTGVDEELSDGDELRFGLVKLVLHLT
jgi:hypothetical protein